MSLIDELVAASQPAKPTRCPFARFLDEFDLGDELRQALELPEVSSAAVARVLTERGHPTKPYSVATHRRGACSCA